MSGTKGCRQHVARLLSAPLQPFLSMRRPPCWHSRMIKLFHSRVSCMLCLAVKRFSGIVRQGPTLGGVRLTLRTGELVGVCGEVGSGKSSLLAALLGELLPLPGPPNRDAEGAPGAPLIRGRLAYCSQVQRQPPQQSRGKLHICQGA